MQREERGRDQNSGEMTSSLPTFRDPSGSLTIQSNGVYRSIHPAFADELMKFIGTPRYRNLVASGQLVDSHIIPEADTTGQLVLNHPLISFRSYPWEWPPTLWLRAAELTLDLCTELLDDGWILKDATPLNVLFQGSNPIFVDIPSIQRVNAGCPLWFTYGQFVRTFLLPMLAYARLGWSLQTMITRRDGYEPEEIYRALPWSSKITMPALTAVTLPALLGKKRVRSGNDTPKLPTRIASDADVVKEVLRKTFAGLRQNMRRAMPPQRHSRWSVYVETAHHYDFEGNNDKLRFVEAVLSGSSPKRVLDVGCNVGVYSGIAAGLGAEVIAIDVDSAAVDRAATDAVVNKRNVLFLQVDLAHPTPATGWENRETASFLDRCYEHFEMVLMLAVLHHLILQSQIPLAHIASLCYRLTTKDLIIEWIPPTDLKFLEILRGRDAIYSHISEQVFRDAFGQYFQILGKKSSAMDASSCI